jgi:hypothetical protein
MAQCNCFSIYNESPTTSYDYYYTDCNTGLPETGGVGPNSTVYTCSSGGVSSNGATISIMNNDSYCGGCECACETFIGFNYKGGGGTISITYTNCNNFTGTIINIIVPESADGGGNQSTYLFAEHLPFSEQPSFCAKVGTPITETGGGVGLFLPLFDGCCAISYATFLVADCCEIKPDGYMSLPNTLTIGQVVGSSTDNNCYIIVDVAEAIPTLEWNNTEFDVLNGCQDCQLSNQYFCETQPFICDGNLISNPTFNSNLSDWTSTPYIDDWAWSPLLGGSAQYDGADEGGFLSQTILTVGNNYSISFDIFCNLQAPTCLNISVFAGETEYIVSPSEGLSTINIILNCTVNTTFSIYAQTNCGDGLFIDNICVIPESVTPTPTPTITPTITPSVTPTQTPQNNTIYFQKCCTPSQYLGVYNYNGLPISQNSSFSIKINNNTFCVKLIPIKPQNVILYDYNSVELVSFNSCSLCYDEHPCPPAPSKQIMGYENECGVITIFPLELECKSTNPSSITSNDGIVSVSITGGTPPYKYYWSGPGISEPNNNSAALEYVHIGDYTVTVVDFYGDFTATTVCTITAEKDCAFSGTVVEFIPPTPTPTPTQTKPPQPCNCKEGTIYIGQADLVASDDMTVYLSFTECTNSVQDFAKIIGGYPFTTSGQSDYNPCIDITTGAIVPSLFIMVNGVPQTLPSNADSYITLGNCCTPPPLLKNYSCVVGVCTLVEAGTGDYTSSNCDNQCGLTYKSWNVTYSFNTKCEQFDICSLQGSTPLTVYTNSSVNSWNNGDSVYINSSFQTEIQAGRYYQNQGRLWSYGPTGLQCFCIIGNTPCSC